MARMLRWTPVALLPCPVLKNNCFLEFCLVEEDRMREAAGKRESLKSACYVSSYERLPHRQGLKDSVQVGQDLEQEEVSRVGSG